jgi:hypothetical protein
MDQKFSVEIAEYYGDDALNALQNGGKWEWSPECVSEGIFMPYNCGDDGCKTKWHGNWYVLGIRIEDGHLYETVQSCDSDGNWECQDECDVDDPHYEEWKKQYDWSEHKRIMQEYSEWVVRHGKDPLDEFMVSRTIKKFRQVTIYLIDGHFFVKNLSRINPQVREYLNLVDKSLADIDWQTIEEFA